MPEIREEEPIRINLVSGSLSAFGIFSIARGSERCPFGYFLRPIASKIRSKSPQISSKIFIRIGSTKLSFRFAAMAPDHPADPPYCNEENRNDEGIEIFIEKGDCCCKKAQDKADEQESLVNVDAR